MGGVSCSNSSGAQINFHRDMQDCCASWSVRSDLLCQEALVPNTKGLKRVRIDPGPVSVLCPGEA